MDPIVEFDRVSFSYDTESDSQKAVSDVSFSLPEGKHLAIIGANGSGKSTLARLMNGLLLPDEGRVIVAGMDTANEDNIYEIRRQCGMVFQNPDNQIIESSVALDIAFGPSNLSLPLEEIEQRVETALELTGLTSMRDRAPHELSGGQKQKLAIAGVLAMEPRCIVLDEATSMLDPRSREELMQLIKKLRDSQNLSIIQVTHYMEEALAADLVLLMSEGRIVRSGRPWEIFSHPEELRKLNLDMPSYIEITQILANIFSEDYRAEEIVDLEKAAEFAINLVKNKAISPQQRKKIIDYLNIIATSSEDSPEEILSSEKVIEVNNLSFSYDDNPLHKVAALRQVTMDSRRGEFLGIVGGTGSGKSTLAQHFNGLIRPAEAGKVKVLSLDLSEKKNVQKIRKNVGLLFQYPEDQLFEETVAMDIAFGPREMGMPQEKIEQSVIRAAKQTEVEQLLQRSPFSLSGGEQRRVAIAGVLVLDPEILILDEPSAGLDPGGRDAIMDDLAQLARAGKTIILISHDLESLARYADRLAVMQEGELLALDTVENIFSQADLLDKSALRLPPTVQYMRLIAQEIPNVKTACFSTAGGLESILKAILAQCEGGDINV